jgi:WD40 repeat protein
MILWKPSQGTQRSQSRTMATCLRRESAFSLYVWSVAGKTLTRSETFGSEVEFLTFSSTNSTLMVYCKDGSLHSLDISAGPRGLPQKILTNHLGIDRIALSQHRMLLATVRKEIMELWKFPTGDSIMKFNAGRAHITAIAFSPDGLAIWTGSADGFLRMWTPLNATNWSS